MADLIDLDIIGDLVNDPWDRKQQALKRLDQLYSGTPLSFPETKKGTWKFGWHGLRGFITLFFGTAISFGYVIPTINQALSSGLINSNMKEVTNTVLGLIPVLLSLSMMILILNIGGSDE